MNTGLVLLVIGIFYFLAHGLALFFQKARIPDVLILLVIGLVLGPFSGMVEPRDFGQMGQILTIIALTVILFESGTSLRLSSLVSSATPTLILTLLTSLLTTGLVALLTVPFFDGKWSLALITGTILSGTSSAVVIPMVQALRMSEKPSTILVLESAFTDVLSIVLTFALVEAVSKGQVSIPEVSAQIAISFGVAAVIGILGGFLWLLVWDRVRKLPASVFTTIAFAFVLYGIADLLGVSGAIATLTLGVTLLNLPFLIHRSNLPSISNEERSFYQEIVFLLKIFFFIYLGVSTQVSNLSLILSSLALVLAIYFVRLFITAAFLTKKDVSVRDASIVAVMVPKGLAAAVLAGLVGQKGIPQADTIQQIVFSTVIFSIFLTAVLIPLIDGGPLSSIFGRVLKRFQLQKRNRYG